MPFKDISEDQLKGLIEIKDYVKVKVKVMVMVKKNGIPFSVHANLISR
jgi:hypothetical protein